MENLINRAISTRKDFKRKYKRICNCRYFYVLHIETENTIRDVKFCRASAVLYIYLIPFLIFVIECIASQV